MPSKGHRKPAKSSTQQKLRHGLRQGSWHGSQHGAQRGQCRIIAGKWRGRKIHFNDAEGLRPTTDRIRETVFNWLQTYLPSSYCLDCFAGSGALGFEALSRGAREVVFIEQNKQTAATLKENARMLQADNTVVVNDDALHWLELKPMAMAGIEQMEKIADRKASSWPKFNLVFLDPPFCDNVLQKVAILLNRSGCLTEDVLIYVEHSVNDTVVLPENWVCLKQKRSGQVLYTLYQRQISSDE